MKDRFSARFRSCAAPRSSDTGKKSILSWNVPAESLLTNRDGTAAPIPDG